MEEGIKYDQEKDRWDLLPVDALEEIVKVYTMGAKKYDDRNWEKGIKYSRIIGAIFRHITSWIKGETFDKESGLHHLAHAAWGCLAIIAFQKRGKEEFNDMQMKKEAEYKPPEIIVTYDKTISDIILNDLAKRGPIYRSLRSYE